MAQDFKHRALLQYIRKIVDVPAGYSKEDLMIFRSIASKDFPALVPLMDDYLKIADNADTTSSTKASPGKKSETPKNDSVPPHLFDMLRDKKLFPSNTDLSEFAGRILPGISRTRFEKVSRADIAARIIEHLETKERHTRDKLEASMRSAIATPGAATAINRKSFFSQWENIIKGSQV